jgi:regulator of protease activity HflC (stomatin/prohibitin superfamily)
MRHIILTIAPVFLLASACTTTIQPGHRGFVISGDGMDRELLQPGRHWTGPGTRIEDVDVSYSTRQEEVHTTSAEGLPLVLSVEVIYRPMLDQLYDLVTEVGFNFYDEIIGPEFRSAARGVFARRSYTELLKRNEQIENEIESDLKRRIDGKHIEISSITLESITYAPEIGKAVTERLAAEQDAARQRTLLENEGMRKKLALEQDAVRQKAKLEAEGLQAKMELEHRAEQAKLSAEASLIEKRQETEIAKQQAALDKIREQSEAEKRLIRAKSEAQEAQYTARANAERDRAKNQALTPLAVQMKAYEALESLGKSGNAHIMLGDWSKVPNFLFPSMLNNTRNTAEMAASTAAR